MQIDPEQIHTPEHLVEQLGELFRQGGWSVHRLAETAGLSTATVQAIVSGATGIPQTGTLKAFVTACSHEPGPWVAARGRAVKAARARPQVVNVPRVEATFVGRAQELKRLTQALMGPDGTGRASQPGAVVVQVVHGLGGVGKSTLAAYWARAHLGEHEVAWWITADTSAGLDAGLADLASALEPTLAGQPIERRAAHAMSWLADHTRWLLVLDNVTDPADVAPLLERDLPGRVVLTSRLAEGWHRLGVAMFRLDVLPEEQAVKLLTTITSQNSAEVNMNGAVELVRELGCLPLAVEQAAAYLHQARLSPDAYLDLLQQNPAVMYDQAARGSDAERTIARIWRITLDTLTDTPLAGQLLRIMAWWASADIPRVMITSIADQIGVTTALGTLAAYNMITLKTETVTVHRLVQAVARTPDPCDPNRQATDIQLAREQATELLNHAQPSTIDDPAHWPAWLALLPHIHALVDHSAPATDTTATANLLNRTATFLDGQGAIHRVITYCERALAADERLRGSLHPDTLYSRNNLAGAYESAGDLVRAIPLYERALAERERVLSRDHPDILTSRNNLAFVYQVAGDLARAIPLFEATLADCERVLSDVHPETLQSRNNLAYAYAFAGDLVRAIPLFERTLAERERVLGRDHPDTLQSRNNLAGAYESGGDLVRAIPLYEATLADCERVLSDVHPDTLQSRNNLAYAYAFAGDLVRAIPLFERTLAERERVLGRDHPDTLQSRNNLAGAYRSGGDLVRAIPLFERTLAERERVLGRDHPDTLQSRNNLACAYRVAEDLARAVPLFEQTLADCERALGPDHPLTEAVRENLDAAE